MDIVYSMYMLLCFALTAGLALGCQKLGGPR